MIKTPDAPSRPKVSPFLVLSFGILAVSTAAIFIRYAQAYAPSLVIAAYRLILSTLALAPVALLTRREELSALRGRRLVLALLAGLFLALHFASWITSLEYTTVASSVVLVTTTPIWVALAGPFFLKESLRRQALIGMLLALTGGIVVGLADTCTWSAAGLSCPDAGSFLQGKALVGDALALLGAWMAAAYLIIGRSLRAGLSLISYTFVVYGMGAVVLILVVLAARLPLLGYPAPAYVWFFMLALVPQLIGHTIFNWSLRFLPAAYVSITLLGEPIGSTVLAFFLLSETPAPAKLFGAVLILAGITIAARS